MRSDEVISKMLFPEDGCLPKITRSGLSPFNNVMIIKVPEQFRKPGETVFQFATLDPSKKTERWPADKFIYKNIVSEEVTPLDCSERNSTKEKESEKSKFEIKVPKSLFALEKQKLKEKLCSAINSDRDKRVTPNVKNYENSQDFKNQNARSHQDVKKSFAAKSYPDNRGFRGRDYNDGKSHYEARHHNSRAIDINPWINPPLEYITSRYDESVKIPVNELENPTVDLLRQKNEASHFYDGEGGRIFGHVSGLHLNDLIPIKNLPDNSHLDFPTYQELPRNANWQRLPTNKRSLLTTPPRKLFDIPPQRNPSETDYFESNRNIPEKSEFRTIPWRGMHDEKTLDFNNSYNSTYEALPDFQYRNQYSNISRPETEFERNYARNSREDSNFHRNHNNDSAVPFNNSLNKIDSYRNDSFHRPNLDSGKGMEYQGRRFKQNANDNDFRKPEGRGKCFRQRNRNNRRDHRGRDHFRRPPGHGYGRGQRNERFQKKTSDK